MTLAIIGTRGYPYVYGGFETFAKKLSERLVPKDVEVHIYCQKNLFQDRPKMINGIYLHYIPTSNRKSLNQLIHSFLSILHATFSSADVILVLNLAGGPMGWIPKLAGKKTIINVDGLEWLRPKWKGFGASYFRIAARLASYLYDVIITDADAMRDIYLKQFKTDSTVIAYGAPPFAKADLSLLKKFKLEEKNYYLIVGRLIPDNNADLIIRGFLSAKTDKKLIIVGDVPYSDKYAEDLKKMACEKLDFVGYIKDNKELMALYQGCFAYFHGHQFGGTNPAMLKAMSNNCAILALNTVFNREMLDNGQFGLLFEHDDLSVRNAITKIENDEKMVNSMRAKVSLGLTEKYNWDLITDKYQSVMKKILNKQCEK